MSAQACLDDERTCQPDATAAAHRRICLSNRCASIAKRTIIVALVSAHDLRSNGLGMLHGADKRYPRRLVGL